MQRGQQGTDLKQALAQERKERVSPSPNVGIACGPFSVAPLESGPPLWGSGMRLPSVILRNAL